VFVRQSGDHLVWQLSGKISVVRGTCVNLLSWCAVHVKSPEPVARNHALLIAIEFSLRGVKFCNFRRNNTWQ
jgi:hypothetical protein